MKPQAVTNFAQGAQLLDQSIVELTSALISGELFMTISGRIERIPANEDRARRFLTIKPQQHIGKAEDRTRRLVAAPQDIFRQSVVHAVRERVSVDHQERPARRFCRLRLRIARRALRALWRSMRRKALRLRRIAQHDPGGGVIARAFFSANLAIDAGVDKALRGLRAQQQMIDAQAGIARPAIAHVIPKRIDRRIGVARANGVDPALAEDALRSEE